MVRKKRDKHWPETSLNVPACGNIRYPTLLPNFVNRHPCRSDVFVYAFNSKVVSFDQTRRIKKTFRTISITIYILASTVVWSGKANDKNKDDYHFGVHGSMAKQTTRRHDIPSAIRILHVVNEGNNESKERRRCIARWIMISDEEKSILPTHK